MKDIIGIEEYIDIPKAGLTAVRAKTDTGAYNSAIGCSHVEEVTTKNGEKRLEYVLLSPKREKYTGKKLSTKKYKKKLVRSSNGTETHRYQIKLTIILKEKKLRTTFNLSTRSKMRYSVLIGRKTIAGKFLVDVSKNRKTTKSKPE